MQNISFDSFKNWVCSWCVNSHRNCNPLHNCEWEEDFNEALNLSKKLRYLEDDPDCIFGSSDEDYNFEAQANAYDNIDWELRQLSNALIHEVQENQDDYIRRFGYEIMP